MLPITSTPHDDYDLAFVMAHERVHEVLPVRFSSGISIMVVLGSAADPSRLIECIKLPN